MSSREVSGRQPSLLFSESTPLRDLRRFSVDKTLASGALAEERLIEVLHQSPLLEQLIIESPIRSSEDETSVVRLVTRLRHLKELRIIASRNGAQALLSDLSAPIEKLGIHVEDYSGDPWDVIPMLIRFTHSLMELDLSALVTLDSFPNHVMFPHMHRLSLNGAYFRHVAPLIFAFPNLQELYIAYAHLPSHEVEDVRASNIAAQTVQKWAKLDNLAGVLRALYVAAIRADVGTMRIQLVDCMETNIMRLNAVLDSTCPRVLDLNFLLRLVHELPNMIPVCVAKNLQALGVCINLAACTAGTRAENLLDGIYSLLAPLSTLTHLTCRLFCPDWSTKSREAYLERVAAFRGMEIHSVATRIVNEVPSLRHMMLDISPGATLLQPDGSQLSCARAKEYRECRGGNTELGEWTTGKRVMAEIGLWEKDAAEGN